jgi:two-component system OmpR family response regulator
MLTYLLGQENYEVTAVRTVGEALRLAQNESYNLYILDEWFPHEAGLGLCRKIREFDPHTPIIFYSGAAFDSDKEEALHAGAQAFVAKPYVDELVDTVRRVLAEQQETAPS